MGKLLQVLLYPFALLYGVIISLRNRLYDSGFLSAVQFDFPVICIGNLSVGGTGKTPHVEYLIRLLQYRYQITTLSRGYKRKTRHFLIANAQATACTIGDEPMQYFNKFNDLTVAVGEDRMTAIPELLRAVPQLDVVILDDAFQHRSVKAGLSILVTEYDQPFWKDHILPLGRLREHPNAAKRSQMVIVSKCPPTIRKEDMQAYKQAVKQYAGHEQVYFTTLDYVAPYNVHTEEKVTLSGYSIILAVGIARPIYLQAYLESKGNKVHALTYRDHHYFTTDDFEEVMQVFQTWSEPNKIVVTTEKDYTRWMPFAQAFKDRGVQLVVQPIEVRFLNNDAPQFNQQIEKYIDEARWAAQSPFQDTNQEVYA